MKLLYQDGEKDILFRVLALPTKSKEIISFRHLLERSENQKPRFDEHFWIDINTQRFVSVFLSMSALPMLLQMFIASVSNIFCVLLHGVG